MHEHYSLAELNFRAYGTDLPWKLTLPLTAADTFPNHRLTPLSKTKKIF